MSFPRRPRIHRRDTPIGDMLYAALGGEPLATWNSSRSNGGEWDYLRSLSLRTRQRLTGAGYMSKWGTMPDEFADLIRWYAPGMGGKGDTECIAWYVRHALLAITERQRAAHHDRHLAYARSRGAPSYYSLRNSEAFLDGCDSLWHKRKAKGWT